PARGWSALRPPRMTERGIGVVDGAHALRSLRLVGGTCRPLVRMPPRREPLVPLLEFARARARRKTHGGVGAGDRIRQSGHRVSILLRLLSLHARMTSGILVDVERRIIFTQVANPLTPALAADLRERLRVHPDFNPDFNQIVSVVAVT